MSGILEQVPEPLLCRRESLLDEDAPSQRVSHRGMGWRTASAELFGPGAERFIAERDKPGDS
jgi:hypothetical protein